MTDDENACTNECKRCGKAVDVRKDRWFRHDWSEEKSEAEIEAALDADRQLEDWFSEGGILCPSCHADFLVFLGAEPADGSTAPDEAEYIVYAMHDGDDAYPTRFLETAADADAAEAAMQRWWKAFHSGEKQKPPNYGGVTYQHISTYRGWVDA